MLGVNFLTPAWRRRHLLSDLVRRDIAGRYRGSAMGVLWSLITPILMLAIYTFVFSVVFNARWGGADADRVTFAIYLYAGLIVHGLVAECLIRAPISVVNNVNFVKRVRFPLDLLAWVIVSTSLFHALIGLVVLMIFFVSTQGHLPVTAPLIVLVWLPLIFGMLGLSWFLAALGVFLRDIGQITGTFSTMLLFLSPIFYPVQALPEPYRIILYVNPLTFIVEQSRHVLIDGSTPDWQGLGIAWLVGMACALAGYIWFQRLRHGFADVL